MAAVAPAPSAAEAAAHARAQFDTGVGLLLEQWTALNLAAENAWAGIETRVKVERMYTRLCELFTPTKRVFADEVADFLFEFMQVELYTEVQDGSVEQVSAALVQLWAECSAGQFAGVERLREAAAARSRTQVVQQSIKKKYEDVGGQAYSVDGLSAAELAEMQGDATAAAAAAAADPDELNANANADADANDAAMMDEDDGWTTVPSKKKGGRRSQ